MIVELGESHPCKLKNFKLKTSVKFDDPSKSRYMRNPEFLKIGFQMVWISKLWPLENPMIWNQDIFVQILNGFWLIWGHWLRFQIVSLKNFRFHLTGPPTVFNKDHDWAHLSQKSIESVFLKLNLLSNTYLVLEHNLNNGHVFVRYLNNGHVFLHYLNNGQVFVRYLKSFNCVNLFQNNYCGDPNTGKGRYSNGRELSYCGMIWYLSTFQIMEFVCYSKDGAQTEIWAATIQLKTAIIKDTQIINSTGVRYLNCSIIWMFGIRIPTVHDFYNIFWTNYIKQIRCHVSPTLSPLIVCLKHI